MNSVKSIKKISKVTGKLKVLGAVLMCAVMVTLVPIQAYADQKFSLRYYVTDTDTTLGTKGNLLDNTKLSFTVNSWWYGKSAVEADGYMACSFGKRNTSYDWEFIENTLTTYMSGLNCNATISSSPSVSVSSSSNGKMYKCSTPYWSYHIRTTANCWTATYEQTGTAQYYIKRGSKKIARIDLLTLIKW